MNTEIDENYSDGRAEIIDALNAAIAPHCVLKDADYDGAECLYFVSPDGLRFEYYPEAYTVSELISEIIEHAERQGVENFCNRQ